MGLKKNFYLIILILSTIFSFTQAQESFITKENSNPTSLNNSTNKNIDNFPFQFGLEYGTTIKLKDKQFFNYGYWFSAGLNLYAKRIWLKSEFGTLKLNDELGGNASYFFLGFSGVPFAFKQHKISISFGLSYYSSQPVYALSFAAGANYLYSFNRFISMTAGIKMPAFGKNRYNEFFHNPMFTVGVQIF